MSQIEGIPCFVC